ncbi:MAG: radical SAM protein, partial [Selenomonadaceae bacterium]|nr:radical SAM protein [Selenomonadaceae bacterium]
MRVTVKVLEVHGGDFDKIVREVLRSLNVVERADTADFDALEIFNEVTGDKVITRIKVVNGGSAKFFRKSSTARGDERLGAEINRLVKKNLYVLLVDNFGLDTVPYGILHGVRPTKIIQRWIESGFGITSHGVIDRDKISRRIRAVFLTDLDKAALLTEVALRQLPILKSSDAKTVGVYVGIPFCKTRCLYCSFPSFVLPADEKVAAFMNVLIRDISAAADAIKRYGLKVQSIYVGGGTPTALPEKFFVEMLSKVFDGFYTDSVKEVTVECGRPDTIDAEKISALKKFPVTRISVNPQTMHQRTLDFIGRAHTVDDVTRAFCDLRT